MRVNLIDIGSIINIFLMLASFAFLWYSFFTFPRSLPLSDSQNYFDQLLQVTDSNYLYLVAFSSLLLFVSVFGYMSLTENESLMIVSEMLLLLLMIVIEVYSIYSLYAEEERMYLASANYMYKGVVLPHKSNENSTDMTLKLTYGELNEIKWVCYSSNMAPLGEFGRCCGIYSWKDAENFRPKDCCRRGYKDISGQGMCNENYGPYVKNCVEARSTVISLEINKYALVVIAMILTEFFGLMLCGMVLFIKMDDDHRALAVSIGDILANVRQNLSRHSSV